MKKIIYYFIIMLSVPLIWTACKKDGNYPGGKVNQFFPLYDLRNLYKGDDVVLTEENMLGSNSVTGVVISDHSGENLPAGLLIIQDMRRLGLIRGISIPIGADATKYVVGDSVSIPVVGATLKRADGILQLIGVSAGGIKKIASNRDVPTNRVGSSLILAKPNDYESTLVALVKAGFDPLALPADTYVGDKILNDGFDDFTLHTEPTATFAGASGLNFNANYYSIIFNTLNKDGKLIPHGRIRTLTDVVPLSSTPEIASIIIAGYMPDLEGGDGNYEYMQFLATKDINFGVTPFSVVVTNNAGASSPTGIFPTKGWATGIDALAGTNARTYKFNLTSGTVAKGEYFYVGGTTKMINGPNSTSMATSKWIRALNYSTTNGDGFGLKTSGLFANSGNASGFAIFEGTTVDVNTTPIDVIFIGSGGSLYSAPNVGYKIANTDFYDKVDPIVDRKVPNAQPIPQPYYRAGTNTLNFTYPATADQDKGFFNKLSGIYDPVLGRWKKARTQNFVDLSKNSPVSAIEKPHVNIYNDANGNFLRADTIAPTMLRIR